MNIKPVDPTAFRPMKIVARKNIEVGFELESIVKKVTLDKIRLYRSQWPRRKNWHNDYEIAQSWGVDKPMVFASQLMEYIGEMLIKFFGKGYVGGTLSVAMVQPVWPEDEIVTKGIVREKIIEGNALRLFLDVWCENQHGDKLLVGKASGLVHEY